MTGLIAYGAYVPYHRLQRAEIAAALGEGVGKGTRAVASYDEDSTSLGVEAARTALSGLPVAARPQRVLFATATPAYLDKANAAVIHAALELDVAGLAFDLAGGVRSAVGAIVAAGEAPVPALAVLADIRTGLPGGTDEREGGDGAAAFLFGPGTEEAPVIAELIAVGASTEEFLDRWRLPSEATSRVWEERFGEHVYAPLAEAAFADALKRAALTPGDVDHLVVSGLPSRSVRAFARVSGTRPDALADDLTGRIGNAGAAQAGILLADVLDRAAPGQVIAVTVLADGATVLLFRTSEALAHRRAGTPVARQIDAGREDLRYATFLSWRGLLMREPPRRPEPAPPAAPPSRRANRYKYGFVGSRCEACQMVHLPPVRVCAACYVVDRMVDAPMSGVAGTVVTHTIDRLAFTPNPPMVAVVVDFDGGGRFKCQIADVDPASVSIGMRVRPTFRRVLTTGGIHNYFWKVKPMGDTESREA